eukprot:gene12786-15002_t
MKGDRMPSILSPIALAIGEDYTDQWVDYLLDPNKLSLHHDKNAQIQPGRAKTLVALTLDVITTLDYTLEEFENVVAPRHQRLLLEELEADQDRPPAYRPYLHRWILRGIVKGTPLKYLVSSSAASQSPPLVAANPSSAPSSPSPSSPPPTPPQFINAQDTASQPPTSAVVTSSTPLSDTLEDQVPLSIAFLEAWIGSATPEDRVAAAEITMELGEYAFYKEKYPDAVAAFQRALTFSKDSPHDDRIKAFLEACSSLALYTSSTPTKPSTSPSLLESIERALFAQDYNQLLTLLQSDIIPATLNWQLTVNLEHDPSISKPIQNRIHIINLIKSTIHLVQKGYNIDRAFFNEEMTSYLAGTVGSVIGTVENDGDKKLYTKRYWDTMHRHLPQLVGNQVTRQEDEAMEDLVMMDSGSNIEGNIYHRFVQEKDISTTKDLMAELKTRYNLDATQMTTLMNRKAMQINIDELDQIVPTGSEYQRLAIRLVRGSMAAETFLVAFTKIAKESKETLFYDTAMTIIAYLLNNSLYQSVIQIHTILQQVLVPNTNLQILIQLAHQLSTISILLESIPEEEDQENKIGDTTREMTLKKMSEIFIQFLTLLVTPGPEGSARSWFYDPDQLQVDSNQLGRLDTSLLGRITNVALLECMTSLFIGTLYTVHRSHLDTTMEINLDYYGNLASSITQYISLPKLCSQGLRSTSKEKDGVSEYRGFCFHALADAYFEKRLYRESIRFYLLAFSLESSFFANPSKAIVVSQLTTLPLSSITKIIYDEFNSLDSNYFQYIWEISILEILLKKDNMFNTNHINTNAQRIQSWRS